MEQAMSARSSTHSKGPSLGNVSIEIHREWAESESRDVTFPTGIENKKLDPQILLILEHVGELYIEQKSTLERLFEGSHDDMWEALKKIKEEVIQIRLSKRNAKVLSRSLSFGSPRRSDVDDVMRLDRFKIRTLDVKQGGGGGVQLGGSK